MKHNCVVWEGRFQPFHIGHLSYVRTLLQHAEQLWIFVVDNEISKDLPGFVSPVPLFTQEVDSHHRAEKNPLPFWLRYQIVVETLRYELGSDAPIFVWGGRRLDLNWDYYKKALPQNRIFLTPLRDSFEDLKAATWEKLGESVERLDLGNDFPKISATMVRERIQNKQDVTDLLSVKSIEILKQYGFFDKI